jgi:hypothetical protein
VNSDFCNRVRSRLLAAAALACAAAAVHAGRPLAVDDTGTNETGAGHIEAWVSRAAGATVINVAPAYAPFDGLEFVLGLSRDTTARVDARTVQVRWRMTPAQEAGCNVGLSAGSTQVAHGGGRQDFGYGMVTCNFAGQGSSNVNLGLVKPAGDRSVRTWGVSYERELGPVTPHVEWFGATQSKPTLQVGARGKVSTAWQLDGTVGRSDGHSLYTLGFKFQF